MSSFNFQTRIFKYNNKIVVFSKDDNETIENFYFRLNYIIHQNIKTFEDFIKYKTRSYYLLYYYIYGCEYDDKKMMMEFKDYLDANNLNI